MKKTFFTAVCLWAIIFLCFVTVPASADDQFRFENLTSEDGLLSLFVNAVVEDHKGFLWIGSVAGLQRFDGNEFRTFFQDSGEHAGLSNNVINCLWVDHYGDLWVGTNNGLNLYSQDREDFEWINLDVDGESFFKINKIRTIFQTDDGVIWLGTPFGLSQYDYVRKKARHYPHDQVSVIRQLGPQALMVGTKGSGLFRFNRLDATFVPLEMMSGLAGDNSVNHRSADAELSAIGIRDILEISSGRFLIASWGKGILDYNHAAQALTSADIKLTDDYVHRIQRAGNGSYWVSSSSGLHVVGARAQGNAYDLELEMGAADNDSERRVSLIYKSKNNDIWIATSGFGLFRHYAESKQFEYYAPNEAHANGLQEKVVIDFAEAPDGKIYLAKLSGNIAVFDPHRGTFRHLSFLRNGKPFEKMITAVTALSNKELLISDGVETFRVRTDLLSQELTLSKQYDLLKRMALVRTNQNLSMAVILAFTNEYLYLLRLNNVGELIIQHSFPYRSTRISNYYVAADNEMYVADIEGEVLRIEHFNSSSPLMMRVREKDNFFIDSIMVDNDKNLWVANNGSKLIVQPQNKPAYFYDIRHKDAMEFGALQYDSVVNSVWLTSTKGLSNIDLNTNTVFHFDELDGVQKKLNEAGATLAARDGSLYFGGRYGFNRFFPNKVKPDLKGVAVRVLDFFLAGERVEPFLREGAVLNQSILNTKMIQLKHEQNSFGFEFSAVLAPFKKEIVYAYQLEGYEDDWSYVSNKKRFARYTNIPPGEYVFKAKVQNKNNVWSEQDAAIKILITPPWWKTSLAYAVYVVAIILLVYLIVKLRTMSLLKRQYLLEVSVERRTNELAIEKNKVEQLLIKKDEEFANVSHEFRTPLTLILGFAKQLIDNRKGSVNVDQLNMIQSNGYRLLRMVNQLLDMERFKVKSIVEKTTVDFAFVIKTRVAAFLAIAQEKNIALKLGVVEEVYFDFTLESFERILINLLSNSVKYTERGGCITVSSLRTDADELKIEIADTGIGIPCEKQALIFERFQRVHEQQGEHIMGAGIGLSLVKGLVEAHQGRIQVNSVVNVGTTMTLYLPIVNEMRSEHIDRRVLQSNINDELIAQELKSIAKHAALPLDGSLLLKDAGFSQGTLLLIDDNIDLLNYLVLILQEDYRVICAQNGGEGFAVAVQEIPDLIVSDVMMPGMDGYQLLEALRTNVMTDHIPVILLTAKSDSESKLKGFSKQADEYLAKPFEPAELKVRVQNLLEIREILKKRFAAVGVEEVRFSGSEALDNDGVENKFLLSLNKVLESMYMDMELRIGCLAEQLKVSERQLFRKLKNTVDMSPSEYLRRFRLQKAIELLADGEKSTVVALSVGFASASYFNKCFRAQYGQTPSEYQQFHCG